MFVICAATGLLPFIIDEYLQPSCFFGCLQALQRSLWTDQRSSIYDQHCWTNWGMSRIPSMAECARCNVSCDGLFLHGSRDTMCSFIEPSRWMKTSSKRWKQRIYILRHLGVNFQFIFRAGFQEDVDIAGGERGFCFKPRQRPRNHDGLRCGCFCLRQVHLPYFESFLISGWRVRIHGLEMIDSIDHIVKNIFQTKPNFMSLKALKNIVCWSIK